MATRFWDVAFVVCGVVIGLIGVVAFRFFSPSPHGYLELFFAFPLMVLGIGISGAGLVNGRFPRAVRGVGWVLLAVAGLPILLVLVGIALLALGVG